MNLSDRGFHWVSSVNGSREDLESLEKRMSDYYASWNTRQKYQDQINCTENHQPDIEAALVRAMLETNPATLLEIGCGSGRMYQRLISSQFHGEYFGLEMSSEVIAQNRKHFAEANWFCGSVYHCSELKPEAFEAIFAYFVLEHWVYPQRGLERIATLLKPGGSLFLVFPDFVEMGKFSSQHVGLRPGLAKELLSQGHLFSALITLFDSRFRLPLALRSAHDRVGPFPVNLTPRCLLSSCAEIPDTDAVYLASKREVESWATSKGFAVRYPCGVEGKFRDNALMQITRPES